MFYRWQHTEFVSIRFFISSLFCVLCLVIIFPYIKSGIFAVPAYFFFGLNFFLVTKGTVNQNYSFIVLKLCAQIMLVVCVYRVILLSQTMTAPVKFFRFHLMAAS
jgi:hypothetical protein